MKKLAFLLVLLLAASPAFAGDIFVKVKTHSDAMQAPGRTQPARDDVSEQWYSATRAAQNGRENGFIVDLDKQMAYMVNHGDKSYVELPMPIDLVKVLPPELQAIAPMMQTSATVNAADETRQIGPYKCTAFDVAMTVAGGQLKMRVWASMDVPGDLAAISAKMLPAFIKGTMPMSDASVKEFEKIRGFQIATETTGDIMGAKPHTTTEVVEIAERSAPAGTFEPPAGYTKKTVLSMQDLTRR
jgi:hypothetical protein